MPYCPSARLAACAFGASLFALVSAQTASAQTPAPFKIGIATELSGRSVSIGGQVRWGVEMALETWKRVRGDKVAGRPIELVIRDDQSNNSIMVTAMNELIQTEKVDVVIGPGASNLGAAAVPPWRQAENHPVWIVPGVSTSVVEKEVGKDPYFFHTFPWTYHYHSTNGPALKEAVGAGKKVAIIYTDDAYGRTHYTDAKKYLKESGFDIVAEELVRQGASDFTPALLKIRARRPDVLYTLMQTDDAVLIAKQVRSAKLNIPYLIGTFQATLAEWKSAVGELQDCWTGVTTYLPGAAPYPADKAEPELLPAARDWEAKWRAKYNREPEYMEAGAYVSAILALLAVEKSNSTDRDKIAAELKAQDHETLLGSSKFSPSEIIQNQAFSKMVVFQQQKVGGAFKSVIFYPPEAASGKLEACPKD